MSGGGEGDETIEAGSPTAELFFALVELAPDAVIVADQDGIVTMVNQQTERILGYGREDLVGQSVDVLVPAVQRGRHHEHREAFWHAPATRPMGTGLDLKAVRADGTEIAVDVSLSPVPTAGGTYVMALVRDVTERRLEEERLANLAAIVESSDDAIFSTGADGVITSWNRGGERIYGHPAEAAIGRSSTALAPPTHRDAWQSVLERVVVGERVEHFDTMQVRADGMVFPATISVAPIVDRHGAVVGMSVITRDVTEQVEAQRTLAESESRLRESEALAHVGGWVWDATTDAVQWSQELHRICGVEPAAFEGTLEAHLAPVHPDDWDVVAAGLAGAASTRASLSLEYRVVRPDGETRWVEVRADPIGGADGTAIGLRGVCHDITERHASEQATVAAYERERDAAEKLRRADRLKDEFLTIVSHELRTPVTAILGFASLVPQQDGEARSDSLRRIQRNAHELHRMVERLLDYSTLAAGRVRVRPVPLALGSVVDQAVAAARSWSDDQVIEVAVPSDLRVSADADGLATVLGNLLSNAVKFAPPRTPIEVSAHRQGDRAVLTVRDHGRGVPPELREEIFTRFFQAGDQPVGKRGTGVGLAIVKEYLALMGGEVWCEDADGGGAVFAVSLPAG